MNKIQKTGISAEKKGAIGLGPRQSLGAWKGNPTLLTPVQRHSVSPLRQSWPN